MLLQALCLPIDVSMHKGGMQVPILRCSVRDVWCVDLRVPAETRVPRVGEWKGGGLGRVGGEREGWWALMEGARTRWSSERRLTAEANSTVYAVLVLAVRGLEHAWLRCIGGWV